MIPISESVQVRRSAWITGLLMIACAIVFIYELMLPPQALDAFIQRWGANPHLILLALAGEPRVSPNELVTLFTSLFLHGGWLHLLGNMVFLWVFGKAVEDRLGHLTYLAVYLLGGAGAGVFQSWMGNGEAGSLIGASGAIATVLGAYLILFPTAWVRVLIPVAFFFWTFDVPAVLMLAFWFFAQFFTGIASISEAAAPGQVAVWAHVAGFALGFMAALVLPKRATRTLWSASSQRGADGPGPIGLVSSVADLAALALGVRILFHFFELRPGPGLLGQAVGLAYGVTNPVVHPFERFVPWIIVGGMPFDLPALVVMLLLYLAAGAVVQAVAGTPRRGSSGSRW